MKDAGEQPEEELHREKTGRILSAESSVPVKLECVTLLASTQKLPNPIIYGFLWRLQHAGMVSY